MVARNGDHTYAKTDRVLYGTRPHALTLHIYNPITLLVLYIQYRAILYSAVYILSRPHAACAVRVQAASKCIIHNT